MATLRWIDANPGLSEEWHLWGAPVGEPLVYWGQLVENVTHEGDIYTWTWDNTTKREHHVALQSRLDGVESGLSNVITIPEPAGTIALLCGIVALAGLWAMRSRNVP